MRASKRLRMPSCMSTMVVFLRFAFSRRRDRAQSAGSNLRSLSSPARFAFCFELTLASRALFDA